MQFPNNISALWEMWEQSVLIGGLEDLQADKLGQHIEKLEEQTNPPEKHRRHRDLPIFLASIFL